MPSKDEIYRIWAPPEALWSRWVKPILFSFVDGVFESVLPALFALNAIGSPGRFYYDRARSAGRRWCGMEHGPSSVGIQACTPLQRAAVPFKRKNERTGVQTSMYCPHGTHSGVVGSGGECP